MGYELLEDDSQDESLVNQIGRHSARTASNVATAAIGFPGDILSLVHDYAAKPISEYITGEEGDEYENSPIGKLLPTTSTHRKGLESQFGEYLKPKNEVEKFADDVAEDTALLLNPGKLAQKGVSKGLRLLKSFGKSLGANLLGESAKQVSGDETSGAATKAGSLFLLSILDKDSAAKQVGKLYSKAHQHLPEFDSIKSTKIDKQLNGLEVYITKKRPISNLSAPEKFVVDQIDKIKALTASGELYIQQAVAQKTSLNKELSTLYTVVPKHSDQKNVRNLAKKLNGYLSESISDYGKTNPKFYKPFKQADEAYGTLANSNFISKWAEDNIVHNPITIGLAHLVAPMGTAVSGAVVPYQATKLLYRIGKSPTLRKIYGNTMKAAAKEDSIVFNKYLKKLDESLQQEESKDSYEFID